MSCYFRHMKDVLDEAGIKTDSENKKALDRIIHDIVDVDYKDCSQAWKAVKERIKGDAETRELFVKRVREALKTV